MWFLCDNFVAFALFEVSSDEAYKYRQTVVTGVYYARRNECFGRALRPATLQLAFSSFENIFELRAALAARLLFVNNQRHC